MPTFDELFDEVLLKVKSAADYTGKKTSEMVEIGKLRYKAKQISWELERTYSKLGVIVYEAKKGGSDFGTVITAAVEEIDNLNRKLDDVEEKIRSYHKAERRRPDPEKPEEKDTADEVVVDFDEIKCEGKSEDE
jgi:uncharacterized coiled-coil DUF342 family protein